MKGKLQIRNSTAEFLIFQIDSKAEGIEVLYQDDTLWLTQDAIAVLFDKSRSTIAEHLQNIFQSQELREDSACRKFRRTAADGKDYATNFLRFQLTREAYRFYFFLICTERVASNHRKRYNDVTLEAVFIIEGHQLGLDTVIRQSEQCHNAVWGFRCNPTVSLPQQFFSIQIGIIEEKIVKVIHATTERKTIITNLLVVGEHDAIII